MYLLLLLPHSCTSPAPSPNAPSGCMIYGPLAPHPPCAPISIHAMVTGPSAAHTGRRGSDPNAEAVPAEAGEARVPGGSDPAVCQHQPGTPLCRAWTSIAAVCQEGQQQHNPHHLHHVPRWGISFYSSANLMQRCRFTGGSDGGAAGDEFLAAWMLAVVVVTEVAIAAMLVVGVTSP